MPGKYLRSAASGLLLAAAVGTAHAAPDPQHIADLLVAAAAATGEAQLAYKAATADGDTITVSGLTVSVPAKQATLTIPAVVISGAAERQPGGFTAERIAFDGGSASAPAGSFKWQSAAMDGAVVASADEVKARARVRPFHTMTVSGLSANEAAAADPIEVATVAVTIGAVGEGTPISVVIKASGVRFPASLVANPIAAAMADRLGYKEFDADIAMDGAYDPSADTLAINALTIDAADIGKIAVTAKFSGLSFRRLSDPAQAKAARAAARLDAMTVRFDDAGFVARMLAMQASMLGGTPDDVRAELVYGALPFALSFIGNTTFRDSLLAATAAFLEDPHSLTFTAAPAEPVPLGKVVRTALHTPTALPDLLDPAVVANH